MALILQVELLTLWYGQKSKQNNTISMCTMNIVVNISDGEV